MVALRRWVCRHRTSKLRLLVSYCDLKVHTAASPAVRSVNTSRVGKYVWCGKYPAITTRCTLWRYRSPQYGSDGHCRRLSVFCILGPGQCSDHYARVLLCVIAILMSYGAIGLRQTGSGNGLLPDCTEILPEPILTNRQNDSVPSIYRQYNWKWSRT